ncbi:cutinase family protein [Arthrobacter sp. KN11-1C]|uniref:cutinase family protein n=1 Tax=Arthrobacter sp. KN11-1C TaxID=3445774 RepID=UPI003FA0E2E6
MFDKLSASFSSSGHTLIHSGVQYLAASVPSVIASNNPFSAAFQPTLYNASESDGVNKLNLTLASYFLRTTCTAPVILAGYSQGAEVVMDAYNALAPQYRRRIVAITLFGDPLFNQRASIDVGTFSQRTSGRGALGVRPQPSPDVASKTRSYCLFQDPICNMGSNTIESITDLLQCHGPNDQATQVTCPHLHYRSESGYTAQAADFVYGAMVASRNAGVTGAPTAARGFNVDQSKMSFDIPRMACGPQRQQLDVWTGMEGAMWAPATKAGVIGACANGSPQWLAFIQGDPSVSEQPVPGLYAFLHAGQHVAVTLTWEQDDPSQIAFTAGFVITEPNKPTVTVNDIFYSAEGAKNRGSVACVTERPQGTGGAPIPHFQDFSLTCAGGSFVTQAPLPSAISTTTLTNMPSGDARTLITAGRVSDGVIILHWVAGS